MNSIFYSVGILNSHKFRDSSWLLNWYVSLSLYKQALGRNQWILLCRSPNGATRRTPRLMELLTHDWTTTTTWREPFSIHTFIEHGILFNNAGISFPFHPTHSSWIWHNELFNSFCISTGCYWKWWYGELGTDTYLTYLIDKYRTPTPKNILHFISLLDYRAVGRSENPGVPIVMWGHNRSPWLR